MEASAEYTRSLPRSTLMAEMRVPNTQVRQTQLRHT